MAVKSYRNAVTICQQVELDGIVIINYFLCEIDKLFIEICDVVIYD